MRIEDERDRIGRLGTAAWRRLKKEKNWNDYMTVGDCFIVGREWAMSEAGTNSPEGKGYNMAFNEWLEQYHLGDFDKSDRAKLFTVMEHRSEIEAWRATLTQTERLKLNHPTTVLRKWMAATQGRPVEPVNLHALAKMLSLDSQAPSKLIELVDAVIDYYEAVDMAEGYRIDGLDELIEAWAGYRGPGINP